MSLPAVRLYDSASDNTPFVTDQPTIRQVLDWHERNASRKYRSAGAEAERRRLWAYFRDDCGHLLVANCQPFDLLTFLNKRLEEDAADNTRRRWNTTLQVPFNQAAKLRLIQCNPFKGLTFKEGARGRDWTDQEYRNILRSTHAPFRRFIVWMRFSGMRPGEARESSRADVNTDERVIVLQNHRTRHITNEPRIVPINSVMRKLIAWHIRHYPTAKRILLNSFGKPWSASAVVRNLDRVRKKTGISAGVKCHGGRHTFITNGLMNGVDVPSMMEIVGHLNMKTTQRYTHTRGKGARILAAMEKAIGKPNEG